MHLLLDTHLLLWAAGVPERLSDAARKLIEDRRHTPVFSVASLWEITIKHSLGRGDFQVNPQVLRRGLLENGYEELSIHAPHVLAVGQLPPLHRDPFDRLLMAQAAARPCACPPRCACRPRLRTPMRRADWRWSPTYGSTVRLDGALLSD